MDRNFFLNQVDTIQQEYRRIDRDWLRTQYRIMVGLTGFTVLVELLMFFLLNQVNYLDCTPETYMLKYVLAPFGCNLALTGIATLLVRARGLALRRRIYGVSVCMALMAFVIYTVHAVFPSIFLIFTFPMVLTVVYGERRLTGIVAVLGIAGKAVSDLFVVWDASRPDVFRTQDSSSDFGVSLMLLLVCWALCLCLIEAEHKKNQASIDLEIERLQYWEESMTDSLTRLWNRQALQEAFAYIDHKRKEGERYFLAMLDIDSFKELNDTFGHPAGDEYLQVLGAIMLEVCGEHAQPFRFGGDEFCILIWEQDGAQARALCDRLRERYNAAEVQQTCRPVTLSIGLTQLRPEEPAADCLSRADAALYEAKKTHDRVYLKE